MRKIRNVVFVFVIIHNRNGSAVQKSSILTARIKKKRNRMYEKFDPPTLAQWVIVWGFTGTKNIAHKPTHICINLNFGVLSSIAAVFCWPGVFARPPATAVAHFWDKRFLLLFCRILLSCGVRAVSVAHPALRSFEG